MQELLARIKSNMNTIVTSNTWTGSWNAVVKQEDKYWQHVDNLPDDDSEDDSDSENSGDVDT